MANNSLIVKREDVALDVVDYQRRYLRKIPAISSNIMKIELGKIEKTIYTDVQSKKDVCYSKVPKYNKIHQLAKEFNSTKQKFTKHQGNKILSEIEEFKETARFILPLNDEEEMEVDPETQ